MTATRLHIARIPAATLSVDDQARQLLASVTPAAPVWEVVGLEDAWRLAEFVDLVDAGYGARDIRYRCARQALSQFVRRNWTDTACRSMCSRSAYLSHLVEQVLDAGAQDSAVAVSPRAAA